MKSQLLNRMLFPNQTKEKERIQRSTEQNQLLEEKFDEITDHLNNITKGNENSDQSKKFLESQTLYRYQENTYFFDSKDGKTKTLSSITFLGNPTLDIKELSLPGPGSNEYINGNNFSLVFKFKVDNKDIKFNHNDGHFYTLKENQELTPDEKEIMKDLVYDDEGRKNHLKFGGKKSRRNRKSKKTKKSRKNRRKSKRTSRR